MTWTDTTVEQHYQPAVHLPDVTFGHCLLRGALTSQPPLLARVAPLARSLSEDFASLSTTTGRLLARVAPLARSLSKAFSRLSTTTGRLLARVAPLARSLSKAFARTEHDQPAVHLPAVTFSHCLLRGARTSQTPSRFHRSDGHATPRGAHV